MPYNVKRYIDNEPVDETELRNRKIKNRTIIETVEKAIMKNNIRYSKGAG